ncbi:allantoate amidohydrolase [Mesobacillus foraminis]|uniref:allantoate amidohydrolase n=1 Tax=Mesobacillus foraminis TaxID=279826 RepID=UPI001BE5F738|nr:allantoate amidohydrolase [Mesobacillus foraminis]MBT2755484.1 allantoate amidohydrolase [Mesobacillus foraminis]
MEKTQFKINGKRIYERADELGLCSSPGLGVTRLPFTPESLRCEALIEQWMKQAGMKVWKDGVNNIIGRYEGKDPNAPVLLIGSHLDTVIEGGKYDGMLGVLTGIEVVQTLFNQGLVLNHPIEVVGFCDEEGVRFHSTFLGSRALVGTFSDEDLQRTDDAGITLEAALINAGADPSSYPLAKRNREDILGYLELHIEQGPVLEKENEPVGVVSGIAGVTRFSFEVSGTAGHAGTVPGRLRQDALAGASEIILFIESVMKKYDPLVATVGKLTVLPGASNVIPGFVKGTLDIRDIDESRKESAINEIMEESRKIASQRGIQLKFEEVMKAPPTYCSEEFTSIAMQSIKELGGRPIKLISGAGHDAMAMAELTDVAMLFVRCKEGLSHHPDEACTEEDITAGAEVLLSVVLKIANK